MLQSASTCETSVCGEDDPFQKSKVSKVPGNLWDVQMFILPAEVDFKTIQWLYNTESQVVSLTCCREIAAVRVALLETWREQCV